MEIRPVTQRVPARRRTPIAVAVAVLAVLAVLVAQPWEERSPIASQVALLPTPGRAPSQPTATSPDPAPTPSPTQAPLPTPDVGPVGPGGEFALVAPPDAALAHCTYGRRRGGSRPLVAIEVLPPRAVLNPDAQESDINRIGWWFEIEANRHERVFNREWEMVARSRRQMAPARSGQPANFTPLTLRFGSRDFGRTEVFRVRVIIEWYTRNFELAGHTEIVANTYQEARDELIGAWPPYCAGVRVSASEPS